MANSKIYLGSTNIGSIFQGADDISIYLGDEKVYPLGEPVFQGKWKATYSDSSVTSAECDSSSAITYNEINKTNLVGIEIGDCVTSIGAAAFMNCSSLTSIDIPNSVTSIGNAAFRYCSGLTSIDIPSGVTSIANQAFENCRSLTSCTIPSGVTSIGNSAFNSCSGLTRLNSDVDGVFNLPSGVTSIGIYAFANCSSLTSIDIPSGVTSIDNGAFAYCSSLTSIVIPNSVTSIDENAFQYCSSLTSIVIPNSVTSIGLFAFQYCSGLTSITVEATTPPTLGGNAFDSTNDCPIYVPCDSVEAYKSASGWSDYASRITCPQFEGKFKATYSGGETYELACDGNTTLTTGNTRPTDYQTSAMTSAVIGDDCVTSIGQYAFSNCSGLTSCTIGSGVTSIGDYAFLFCTSLTSIDIPSGVTSIGQQVFQGCSSLTSIDIPSGVTSIGNYAFSGCKSLTSLDIPDSVTSIGKEAFSRCSGLTSVTVNATTPPTLDGDFVFYSTNECPIYVPSGSVETYKSASGWSEYASRIQAIPNS